MRATARGDPGGPAFTSRRAGRVLMDVLFPGRCLLCGERLRPEGSATAPLCATCLASLPSARGRTCGTCGTTLVSEEATCTRCREAGYSFLSHVALFPFSGMKDSFFGVLHTQGQEAVRFFTESKVIIQRWF